MLEVHQIKIEIRKPTLAYMECVLLCMSESSSVCTVQVKVAGARGTARPGGRGKMTRRKILVGAHMPLT